MISDQKIIWRDRRTFPNSVLENSFSIKEELSCETNTCRQVTAELRLNVSVNEKELIPLLRNKTAERRGR